ncbi:MAG TPA: GNAT family N-acetyltransferase [Candidatus Sulfotelmatobacter sp.]|nr:GNAT family N-acetyltransferase [Candidatus Sulfotelmatobacter sp.]
MQIRELRPADVAPLDRVLQAAYGRPSSWVDRLASYLRAPQVASFVADDGAAPVGCVFAIDYETVAYVSMMGVDPAMHRRGIARALFAAMLAWGEARRLPWRLDATAMGAPLYASFGFVDDGETVVYAGEAHPVGTPDGTVRRATSADLDAMTALDRRAFGADRGWRLASLIEEPETVAFVGGGGAFAMARPHDLIGPIAAPNPQAAEAVIDAALALRSGAPRRIHLPSTNAAGPELLAARGFAASRRLRHMTLGKPPAGDSAQLWGRISLGEG